jgi:general secretion pathway protein L
LAHKILGIDLGAWSVKVAELEAGFRQSKLTGLFERPLLPRNEGESELECAARTLRELIADKRLEAEMCATTLGGQATLRLLKLPLSDPKKIEQVLGYELESEILGDLTGLVWDSVIAGQSGDSTNVIAVAAPRALVRTVIDALAGVQAEPRFVGAAALSYAALRGHAFESDDAAAPVVIIDLGHKHTHVCVAPGSRVLFARSIARGGDDVTQAMADAYRLSYEDAEQAKHERAFLAAPGTPLESPAHRHLDEIVRAAVRPLVRELRQTMAAYLAGGTTPARMLLSGGAARLRGLREHLELELGIQAAPLELRAEDPFIAPELYDGSDRTSAGLPAQALGLALAAAAPVPQVNLRKGDLAYRSDFSYLRGKAAYMVLAILSILMFAGVNAAAGLRGLHKEGDALEARLKRETGELFGRPRTDAREISDELRQGFKGDAPAIPTMSAYDVLDEIARHVPPPENGKLDITQLDIKSKKIAMKGTAESAKQVDELASALEKVECFEKVEKGQISSVTVPPSGENAAGDKAREMKQFSLSIDMTCM